MDFLPCGFPHSDIPGSSVVRHLPRAFRSLPRPSSAFATKASPVRPLYLASLAFSFYLLRACLFFTMGFQLLSHGLLYCAFVFVCLLYLLPSCLACMVEMSGFEPLTPCLQSRCSPAELHPHTFTNKHSASTSQKCIWLAHVRLSACLLFTYSAEEQKWWALEESNLGPCPYQGHALTY